MRQACSVFRRLFGTLPATNLNQTDRRLRRSELFEREKIRQNNLIGLTEKIEVRILAPSIADEQQPIALVVNKDISTPNDCALCLNRTTADRAALAMVNGQPWDMHRPLSDSCEMQFLFYNDIDPKIANKTYWRSCSFILGYILETCFKDTVSVALHSWPAVDIRSGSFIYDVDLGKHSDHQPSKEDLRIISRVPVEELRSRRLPFERLLVDMAFAMEIFQDNPYKCEHIKAIAGSTTPPAKIPLYRMGSHVDISRGPMINCTAQLGFYSVTAFHPIETQFGRLTRVQGVSVPFTQRINSWAWEVICDKSRTKNPLPLPSKDLYLAADLNAANVEQ